MNQVLSLSIASAVCYWGSFRPLGYWWCAWLVPVFWAFTCKDIIDRRQRNLGTASSYVLIGLGGMFCWLGLMNWMYQDAWWLVGSWFFIAIVLGCGWSFFIWLTVNAVLKYRVPLPFAMAVYWNGLEWIRSNLIIGGFPLAALEHSQYPIPHIVQCVDIFGQYGLGFVMVLTGGFAADALAEAIRANSTTTRSTNFSFIRDSSVCGLLMIGIAAYGEVRLSHSRGSDGDPEPIRRIALLQTATRLDVVHPCSVEDVFSECQALTIEHSEGADLVVWPESVCPLEWRYYEPGYVQHDGPVTNWEEITRLVKKARQATSEPITELIRTSRTPILLNLRVRDFLKSRPSNQAFTNSVLLVDPIHGITERYDKVKLTPLVECDIGTHLAGRDLIMPSQCVPGTAPGIIPVRKMKSSPQTGARLPGLDDAPFHAAVNICYDSLFPHVIRKQVQDAASRGVSVDLLINVSNDMDSTYTTFVDAHLATHVFRAVENRKPYVVASNCGSSTWIDSCGRIIKRGIAGNVGCVEARIQATSEWSFYQHCGDILPLSCIVFAFVLMPCCGLVRIRKQCDRECSGRQETEPLDRPGVEPQ